MKTETPYPPRSARCWRLDFLDFCIIYINVGLCVSLYPHCIKKCFDSINLDLAPGFIIILNLSDLLLQFGGAFFVVSCFVLLLGIYRVFLVVENRSNQRFLWSAAKALKYATFIVLVGLVLIQRHGMWSVFR